MFRRLLRHLQRGLHHMLRTIVTLITELKLHDTWVYFIHNYSKNYNWFNVRLKMAKILV